MKDETKEGEAAWSSCWAVTGERSSVENGAFYLPIGVKGKKVRENTNEKLVGQL